MRVNSVLSVAAFLSLCLTFTGCSSSNAAADIEDNKAENVEEIVLQTENINETISEQPILEQTDSMTKDQLYYKCMNTLEYLGQVSGSVSTLYGENTPHVFEGEFEFDFVNDIYHSVVNAVGVSDPSLNQINEYYNDGNTYVTLCNYSGSQEDICIVKDEGSPTMKTVVFADACPVSLSESEAALNEDSEIVTSIEQLSDEQLYSTYGADPTGAHEIGTFYIPQEMTEGFLKNFDNWEITGTQEVQGRTCIVVNGNADPEYGDRFGVSSFEILVDQETGVWMQYEGYDADGVVQAYVYTENIQFDTNAVSVPAYSSECSENYSIVESN